VTEEKWWAQPASKAEPKPISPVAKSGKVHPAPVPLTFGQTFAAVFLAILAAAIVISLVNAWINLMRDHDREQKEIRELLHRP
jgi:hypothetical protein